jgi:hypothetical protein
LRILRAHVDGLDIREFERLARWTPRRTGSADAADPFGEELQRRLVDQLESPKRQLGAPALVAEMLLHDRNGPDGGELPQED